MQLSGLKVVYDPEAPALKRCMRLQTPEGYEIKDEKTYVVATNDFLLDGGDGFYTFYRGSNVRSSDFMIRQVVTQYIRRMKTVRPSMGGRYTVVETPPITIELASRPEVSLDP
jgi:2',3'-cyclic-nucleotide 2'-phosphodiesterase/3'-nucleotidase